MLERIRIVLVRPRRGGNVGSVARVMKNVGLGELVLVAPRTRVGEVGARMAAHARDVLAARTTVASLQDAVGDCVLIAGTAGRDFAHLAPVDPRAAARELVAASARGRVALVFGPEDHGLSNADLGICQRLIRIPTADAYPSLNLAQAVAVCGYELLRSALEDRGSPASGVSGTSPTRRRRSVATSAASDERAPASGAEREALIEHLARALDGIDFLSRQNPGHILADVRALFARAGLTRRDVKIWRGIARQMLWAASREKG